MGGPLCGHTLGICLPKGSSYSQVLAVFLAHARSHPAQWHEDAAPQFQLALMTAFPCKDDYPAPRTDEPARAFPLPKALAVRHQKLPAALRPDSERLKSTASRGHDQALSSRD